MSLFELVLDRDVELIVLEDNQATIKIARKGYSSKLRHVLRFHKIDLGSIKDVLDAEQVTIEYVNTNFQAADVFTKALKPEKWQNAMDLIGMQTGGTVSPEVKVAAALLSEAERLECPPAEGAGNDKLDQTYHGTPDTYQCMSFQNG